MAFELTGDVEVLRIVELLAKVLSEGDLANYYIAIDNQNDSDTKNVSLAELLAFASGSTSSFNDSLFEIFNNADNSKKIKLSGSSISTATTVTLTVPGKDITIGEEVYEPSVEPVIVLGAPNVLTVDLNNAKQIIIEPRLSSGVQAINVDHTVALSNAGNGRLFSLFYKLTGTRIITFPSDVKVSVPSTLGGWATPNLTIAAGVDDNILFVAQKNKTGNFWDISINEKSV